MKLYYVILDGAADWKISVLSNKTPLQAASTPNLDVAAIRGQQSAIEILPNGIAPETDSGLMALLSYPPMEFYCGRGTLEAIGLELHRNHKYYAGFRINFASYDSKAKLLDRRTSRDLSSAELSCLANEIREKVTLDEYPEIGFELIAFGAHRGILCFYSDVHKLSGNITNTDPCYIKQGSFSVPVDSYTMEICKSKPMDSSIAATLTAAIVNSFSTQCIEILSNSDINKQRIAANKSPSNCIIIRGGGVPPQKMIPFYKKFKKSITIFGGLPCERGLAELIDCEFRYSKALELQHDGDYLDSLASNIIECQSDVAFCHLKGPDEPGHDHNPKEKVRAIELIDKYFFSRIISSMHRDDVLAVTCDHATPCDLGLHSGDSVPLLISGAQFEKDDTIHFDEQSAISGRCKVLKSTDVLNYVFGV